MVLFRSCSGYAVFTVNFISIIVSHPIGNVSITLNFGHKMDGPKGDNGACDSEQQQQQQQQQHLTPHSMTFSEDSGQERNSSSTQPQVSYVNNIYLIGDIVNASVVKLGESAFGKDHHVAPPPVTGKKKCTSRPTTCTTRKPTTERPEEHTDECGGSSAKPTKTRFPEYFEKVDSTTCALTLTAHHRSSSADKQNADITCHCPAKTDGTVTAADGTIATARGPIERNPVKP